MVLASGLAVPPGKRIVGLAAGKAIFTGTIQVVMRAACPLEGSLPTITATLKAAAVYTSNMR